MASRIRVALPVAFRVRAPQRMAWREPTFVLAVVEVVEESSAEPVALQEETAPEAQTN